MSRFAIENMGFTCGQAWTRSRPIGFQAALVAAGVVGLALASKVAIPMVPVPVTLQTFALTFIGALFGWRLGGVCVVVWLIAGAAGLPVFAGAAAGLQKFTGPTAGYLFAFPIAAIVIGVLVERGWAGNVLVRLFLVMLIGNAVCLGFGAAWLGASIGLEKAVINGVLPFIVGATLKSALAAMTLKLVLLGLRR